MIRKIFSNFNVVRGNRWDWVRIPILLLLVAYTVSITRFLFVENPLPWPDRGSRIYACPSEKAKDTTIRMLYEVCGMEPQFRRDTRMVKRALFIDGTIINYTEPEMHEKIGNAAAGLGIIADDPVAMANKAAGFLRERGYQAEVLTDLEDAPKGSLVFLKSPDAFGNWVIVFRKHFMKMGPRPPKWEWKD